MVFIDPFPLEVNSPKNLLISTVEAFIKLPGLTGLPSLSQLIRGGGSPVATHWSAFVVP